jgi:hypothetical protein
MTQKKTTDEEFSGEFDPHQLRMVARTAKPQVLTYAHVCSRMLTYAHVCSRMPVLSASTPYMVARTAKPQVLGSFLALLVQKCK